MSIIEPKIDVLLDRTDNDRFLLCALASKRAHDINDMMRGQRDRAIQLQTAVEIARAADKKPLSLAFNEIARGEVSYDPELHRRQEPLEVPQALRPAEPARRCERPQAPEPCPLCALPSRAAKHASAVLAAAIFERFGAVLADLLRQPARFVRSIRANRVHPKGFHD